MKKVCTQGEGKWQGGPHSSVHSACFSTQPRQIPLGATFLPGFSSSSPPPPPPPPFHSPFFNYFFLHSLGLACHFCLTEFCRFPTVTFCMYIYEEGGNTAMLFCCRSNCLLICCKFHILCTCVDALSPCFFLCPNMLAVNVGTL